MGATRGATSTLPAAPSLIAKHVLKFVQRYKLDSWCPCLLILATLRGTDCFDVFHRIDAEWQPGLIPRQDKD